MPLWLAAEPLVLARRARSRRAMLAAAGIPVEVVPADIDERGIEARRRPARAGEVAALLAREKARAVPARMPGPLVLGADQTLALGERRFSKPADRTRRASSSWRCAARPMSCMRRSRWCATAQSCSSMATSRG